MKKYVIAYLNFFDNQLIQKVWYGFSEYEVALDYLAQEQKIVWDEEDLRPPLNYESLLEALFNMDTVLSVIEI